MFGSLQGSQRRFNSGDAADDRHLSRPLPTTAVPVCLCFVIAVLTLACLTFIFIFESFEHRYPWESSDTALTGWRERERPLLFVHMNKAGGTTLCHLAKSNGERILAASWDHNCNFPNDGPVVNWGLAQPLFTSCQQRLSFIKERGVTFNSIEHFLDNDTVCSEDMIYFTILRDPIKRLESLARYERINGSTLIEWATGSGQIVGHYHQVDNYYIRMLCGQLTFEQPRGAIGLREYLRARRVLAQFHYVLVTEHLEEDLPVLSHEFGWRRSDNLAEAANTSPLESHDRYFLTEDQTKELTRINEWDVLLYQAVAEARQLISLKAQLESINADREEETIEHYPV